MTELDVAIQAGRLVIAIAIGAIAALWVLPPNPTEEQKKGAASVFAMAAIAVWVFIKITVIACAVVALILLGAKLMPLVSERLRVARQDCAREMTLWKGGPMRPALPSPTDALGELEEAVKGGVEPGALLQQIKYLREKYGDDENQSGALARQ